MRILLLFALAIPCLCACAGGIHGHASGTQHGASGRATVFSIPLP